MKIKEVSIGVASALIDFHRGAGKQIKARGTVVLRVFDGIYDGIKTHGHCRQFRLD